MLRRGLQHAQCSRSLFMQTSPLQAPSGTRSTSAKARLPRLPVPDLHKTLQKYVTSLEPFLLEDEVKGLSSYAQTRALRERWADNFEHGIGKVLQERLQGACHPHCSRYGAGPKP